jgi:hypothetical protein
MRGAVPQYFPLMNGSPNTYNPDGDIQQQVGRVGVSGQLIRPVFVDPLLISLPWKNVVHTNVQGSSFPALIDVDTIREYSELAAQGWNIDYSTLQNAYNQSSPLAKWYQTCFDVNGVRPHLRLLGPRNDCLR